MIMINSNRFEEDLLKCVQHDRSYDLKELLMKRLDELPADKTSQLTLLSFCLLDVLIRLKTDCQSPEEIEMLDVEVKTLLTDPKILSCFEPLKRKVYDLMASLGDDDNLIFFGKQMKDHDTIVDFLIKRNRMKEVLNHLSECEGHQLQPLLMKYGYFLLKWNPKETIQLLKRVHGIKPMAILACLLQGNNSKDPSLMRHVISLLDDFVSKKKDDSVLNQLLTLYADFDEKKLKTALETRSINAFNFESIFILDSCQKRGLNDHSVKVLEKMGLHEDAVKQALSVGNVLLAQQVAQNPSLDDRISKKLWLTIASSAVSDEETAKQTFLKLTQESQAVSMADMLPLLPDIKTIHVFKSSICSCLQEYSAELEALKTDMEEAGENVDQVKEDLKKWRNESIPINTSSRCCICRHLVMSSSFLAFPCLHFVHEKCLPKRSENLEDLECSLCGQDMIDSIQEPLPRSSVDRDWS